MLVRNYEYLIVFTGLSAVLIFMFSRQHPPLNFSGYAPTCRGDNSANLTAIRLEGPGRDLGSAPHLGRRVYVFFFLIFYSFLKKKLPKGSTKILAHLAGNFGLLKLRMTLEVSEKERYVTGTFPFNSNYHNLQARTKN